MKEAEEIAASRRMNSLTLNRHTEILEVLEIPQLMDTCVRNAYYEEALELAAYVKRLERKHASLHVIQVRRALAHRVVSVCFGSDWSADPKRGGVSPVPSKAWWSSRFFFLWFSVQNLDLVLLLRNLVLQWWSKVLRTA